MEIACQAGHSPEECLRTYAHTFEEFDPGERISAEKAITGARRQIASRDVRNLYARTPIAEGRGAGMAAAIGSRRGDSNPGPLHYERFRGCLAVFRAPSRITAFRLLMGSLSDHVAGLAETR